MPRTVSDHVAELSRAICLLRVRADDAAIALPPSVTESITSAAVAPCDADLRLYTVTVAGIVSPSASASRGTVASIADAARQQLVARRAASRSAASDACASPDAPLCERAREPARAVQLGEQRIRPLEIVAQIRAWRATSPASRRAAAAPHPPRPAASDTSCRCRRRSSAPLLASFGAPGARDASRFTEPAMNPFRCSAPCPCD